MTAKIIAFPAKPLGTQNAYIAEVTTKQAWLHSIRDRAATHEERQRFWHAYSQAATARARGFMNGISGGTDVSQKRGGETLDTAKSCCSGFDYE